MPELSGIGHAGCGRLILFENFIDGGRGKFGVRFSVVLFGDMLLCIQEIKQVFDFVGSDSRVWSGAFDTRESDVSVK